MFSYFTTSHFLQLCTFEGNILCLNYFFLFQTNDKGDLRYYHVTNTVQSNILKSLSNVIGLVFSDYVVYGYWN